MAMPISLNIRYTKYVIGHNRYCLSLNKNKQYILTPCFVSILPSHLRSGLASGLSIHDFGFQFDVEYKLQGTLLRIFLLFMITCLFSDPNVSLTSSSKIHSIYALLLSYEETELHTHIKEQKKKVFLYFSLFMQALK